MGKKEINNLILNQKIHTLKLKVHWATEEIKNFNEATVKTISSFEYFYRNVKIGKN